MQPVGSDPCFSYPFMPQYEIEVDSQDEYHDDYRARPAASTQVKSEIVKKKGRGFSSEEPTAQVLSGIKHFETLKEEVSGRAQRSIEGWVIFVTGLNEEVNEEDVEDKFNDFGKVREVRMNLDHRTGYVKGYALIVFEEYKAAAEAIKQLNGKEWLGTTLKCDFCFVRPKQAQK